MDEQLYLMAVGLSLDEKIEKAIETYRTFEHEALKRSPDGYYLCDSYGKDSCVILDLAKRSGVKFKAHHNLTTLDPPELVLFGRKHHPETVVHKPAVPMLRRLSEAKTILPTRTGRWCCEEYKERGGNGLVKVFGVRAAESNRRKAAWRLWQPQSKTDSFVLNPILFWTDEDVWRYLKGHDKPCYCGVKNAERVQSSPIDASDTCKECGRVVCDDVPYCSLYDEGWTRLGCVGCPMSCRRKDEFKRWPKIGEAWSRAIGRFWFRMHGAKRDDGKPYYWAKFKTPNDLWDWWMEERQPEAEDDCQMGLF